MADAATADVILLPAGIASAMTGRSERTLARMAKNGKLRITRTDGGHRRYRLDEISALASHAEEEAA